MKNLKFRIGLFLILSLSACGLNPEKKEAQSVAGWWLATSVMKDGERFNLEKEQSVLVGFNDVFQMYVLDVSDRDCTGVRHGYKVESGNIAVPDEIKINTRGENPLVLCESKSARVKDISTRNYLVLSNVKLNGRLVYDEVSFKAVNKATVDSLYELAFRGIDAAPVAKYVSEERKARVSSPKVQPLEGFYLIDHYLLDGTKYDLGQEITFQNRKGKLPMSDMILHFKEGSFIQYINGSSLSQEYVNYTVEGQRLKMGGEGYQIQEVTIVDRSGSELRLRGMLLLPVFNNRDIVFKKISDEKAGELLNNNTAYQRLKP